MPDAGGRQRQLVRHRPERDQSIGNGVGHQAADREDRAPAGALDAERVASVTRWFPSAIARIFGKSVAVGIR